LLLPKRLFANISIPQITLFGAITIEKGLSIPAYRIIFIVAALLFLLVPAFRDYSTFFPDRFKMNIYFDDEGIKTVLQSLTADEVATLRIAPDWPTQKAAYFRDINSQLTGAGVHFQFSPTGKGTTTIGETTFKVVKLDWGIQEYEVIESHGTLQHSTLKSDNSIDEMVSDIDLLDTSGRMINASFKDTFFDWGKLIEPEYKQVFRTDPNHQVVKDTLIAATRVWMFPYIDIGRTIYMQTEASGDRVPIGYAVYSRDE
jgi:hypothetical protein